MIAMLPRIALISTLAVILLAVGGCAAASPSTAPELPATATQDSADAGGTSGSNSGDDGASDATGAGAYLDYTDGVIAETPGAKALFFHATWCPQCRQLDDELVADGAPDGLTVFKVDFDDRVDLRQQYGVTLQTTIVFVDNNGDAISNFVLYDDPSIASLVAAIP